MNASERHHFVPQWYLRNFCDPITGMVQVYDKQKSTYRRQKPREIMFINRYYRQEWAPEGIDPDIFEKMLSTGVEGPGKLALQRLITMPSDFRAEETVAIMCYLAFQRLRVPRQARWARMVMEQSLLQMLAPELKSHFLDGTIEMTEGYRFRFMKEMLRPVISWFCRMRWNIFETAQDVQFITTDSPVSFFNVSFPPPAEAGIGFVGTKVLFPISPHLMLIMSHPEYDGGSETIDPLTRLEEPKTEDGGVQVVFQPPLPAEAVRTFNSCMFRLSDRIVVSQSKSSLEKCVVDTPPW